MIAPNVLQRLVVDGRCPGAGSGMQPPDGPPICTALHFLPSGMPPPMSKTIWRSVVPIGTSTRPVRLTLPDRAKTLVPLLLGGAHRARTTRRRWSRISGQVGQRLDVVDDRRLAEQALDRRERRPRARHAALALDAVDQRGLLAADERAGAHLDDDVEVEAAVEDVLARAARRPWPGRWPSCRRCDGQRVLGADVDVGLGGADGVGGDDHAFEQPVRVALEHRAVHERARVALVGVADQVLLLARRPAARTSTSCPSGSRRRRGRAGRSARPRRRPRPASSSCSALASAE